MVCENYRHYVCYLLSKPRLCEEENLVTRYMKPNRAWKGIRQKPCILIASCRTTGLNRQPLVYERTAQPLLYWCSWTALSINMRLGWSGCNSRYTLKMARTYKQVFSYFIRKRLTNPARMNEVPITRYVNRGASTKPVSASAF